MGIIYITELPPFSKKASTILSDDEYRELREYLVQNPQSGDVIPNTGGIRKLRWCAGGKGKRGGARIIYFYHLVGERIYLMACYTKNEQTDISQKVKKHLKDIVNSIKKG